MLLCPYIAKLGVVLHITIYISCIAEYITYCLGQYIYWYTRYITAFSYIPPGHAYLATSTAAITWVVGVCVGWMFRLVCLPPASVLLCTRSCIAFVYLFSGAPLAKGSVCSVLHEQRGLRPTRIWCKCSIIRYPKILKYSGQKWGSKPVLAKHCRQLRAAGCPTLLCVWALPFHTIGTSGETCCGTECTRHHAVFIARPPCTRQLEKAVGLRCISGPSLTMACDSQDMHRLLASMGIGGDAGWTCYIASHGS